MQVSKWGNSLAVRLPSVVVEQLQLKEGDDIEITADSGPRFIIHRKPSPEEMLARLREFRGKLPADFRFDRNKANER